MENTEAIKRGDSLEMAVEHIFKVANFKTERNIFIAKYEIDVKVSVGDRIIIIECKNYQNSNLTIRNLIHQWSSKNQIIKAHKVVLVLAGLTIKESDYELASEFDIELWNQEDLTDLFNLSLKPEELRLRLLEKVSFKPITIAERYRDNITSLVIKPMLSSLVVDNENLYFHFNNWLRAHILTELQIIETTKEERQKHIHLFEGSKKKKGFLNFKKKRSQVDYWNTVLEQLTTTKILPEEIQNRYTSYMNGLMEEYTSQKRFFDGDDYLEKAKKLIQSRIQNAIIWEQECVFKIDNMQNSVRVIFLEDSNFSINVSQIDESQANVLNWILTSQKRTIVNQQSNITNYFWVCSSFPETVEKVYRIFTEFYELSRTDSIKDLSIK